MGPYVAPKFSFAGCTCWFRHCMAA